MHPGFLTNDIDRCPHPAALARMCDGTATSIEIANKTGLCDYTGTLWPEFKVKGPIAWILSIGKYGRRRRGYGQQYCRQCLEEDTYPYFRRRWRLAFCTVCTKHGIYLRDDCQFCGHPVEFHTGDFGKKLFPSFCPITICAQCGQDLREDGKIPDGIAPIELIRWQGNLAKLLSIGFSIDLPGASNFSHLFFEGYRILLRALSSRGKTSRLRNWLLQDAELLPLGLEANFKRSLFEEMRIGDRSLLISLSIPLIMGWPETLIAACRASHVSSSYFRRYTTNIPSEPYWFNSEVKKHLYDKDYSPSQAERLGAQAYLRSIGQVVNNDSVNSILGVSSRKKFLTPDEYKFYHSRWNPRGPNSR